MESINESHNGERFVELDSATFEVSIQFESKPTKKLIELFEGKTMEMMRNVFGVTEIEETKAYAVPEESDSYRMRMEE